MCDTFLIPPELSASGNRIFAKNSDREPNEPQSLVQFPCLTRDTDKVQTSFISVEHPRDINAILLSKPFHLWGAEMGVNEYKVAIGNEAVFTRIPKAKQNTGLTGMDMIRLALECSRSAKEALDRICYYIEVYGQDACGGYLNKNFFYDNSFIIADPKEGYVLETAGRFWVYKKLRGFYAISNRLTITTEWDGISDKAIEYAKKQNWINGNDAFSFADAFTAPFMSTMARAKERRTSCETHATVISKQHKLNVADAIDILRSHKQGHHFLPHKGGMDSLCLHATGLLTPSQTTGSMVAELDVKTEKPVWCTGSSAPCLSLFKPFFVGNPIPNEKALMHPGELKDNSYWWQWEEWHRMALKDYPAAHVLWKEKAFPLEQRWLQAPETSMAMEESLAVLHELKKSIQNKNRKYPGLLYSYFWNRWDKLSNRKELKTQGLLNPL
jgi:dipeptidase